MKIVAKASIKNGVMFTLLCGFLNFQAYAYPDQARVAYPPHHLKSQEATLLPFGLTPAQVKQAYGFNSIPFQGEGQTIAIITAYDAPTVEADLGVFSTTFGLPPCTTANGCFKKIYAGGPSQPRGDMVWALEANLDVQWAHAMAPKAKILLIEGSDDTYGGLFLGVNVAVQNGASVVSMSWGMSEFDNEASADGIFNVPGVTFVAAVGDTGNGPLYPAVSPYVIAVGGTKLSIDGNGNYLSETAWAGSGGGLSLYESEPSYQVGYPLPNNPNRLRGVPDVSYNADPNSGFAVYSSFGYQGWITVGGTSAGTPQWAAIIANIKSGTQTQLTGINSLLYTVAQQKYQKSYNDITTGSNGSCGYYCTAQVGYDYVTGLGSPKLQYLPYGIIFNGLKQSKINK